MAGSTPRRYLIHLREMLNQYFNKGELKTLCFDLELDYDDLAGERRSEKAQELVAHVDRHGLLDQFINRCQALRPHVDWLLSTKKIFIAYKRNSRRDSQIATFLHTMLQSEGHDVFIDRSLRTGASWLDEIDKQIKLSDFLIVLLSPESADSEMVQSEVKRAYDYRKQQGNPQTIPIRINFDGLLPYTIDAFLNKYQYVTWESEDDTEQLGSEILAAIDGRLSNRQPVRSSTTSAVINVSEDGRITSDQRALQPPLPEFDPRGLDELLVPGGTVNLRDQMYVRRDADPLLENQMMRPSSITTIRGSRQTGKSSLLLRGVHHGRSNGHMIVNLDLQRVSRDYLVSLDAFLRYLATFIVRKLRLDTHEVDRAWEDVLGPQDKISVTMQV